MKKGVGNGGSVGCGVCGVSRGEEGSGMGGGTVLLNIRGFS